MLHGYSLLLLAPRKESRGSRSPGKVMLDFCASLLEFTLRLYTKVDCINKRFVLRISDILSSIFYLLHHIRTIQYSTYAAFRTPRCCRWTRNVRANWENQNLRSRRPALVPIVRTAIAMRSETGICDLQFDISSRNLDVWSINAIVTMTNLYVFKWLNSLVFTLFSALHVE